MADPISATVTAIATFASSAAAGAALSLTGSAAFAASVGNFVLAATPQLLLATATSVATALFAPNVEVEGSPTSWRTDPSAGIPFAFGETAVAGVIVHRDEYGKDNRYQSIVTVLSGAGPIQAIDQFYASDVAVNFGTNGIATNGGNFASNMWLQTSLGAQPQATALSQTGLPGGSPGIQGWSSSSKISGKAHTMLTLRQDSKRETYPAGVPRIYHKIRGIRLYDPRLDSTYPGGSGSQRLDNRSTWAYSENPYIAALNWALGLYENGVLVGGIGADISGIDVESFIEGANVADANGWTVSGVPTTRDDKAQVLRSLLQAGGGRYINRSGKISCLVRTARSSVATITADDTAGPVEISVNADRLGAVNSITPRVRMASQKYEAVDQPEVSEASYVTEDGGKRQEGIVYPYVLIKADSSNKDQPAQLAAYDLVYSREPISASIPLKPHLAHVEPGDIITIDEDGFYLDGVNFLVVNRRFDPIRNISTVDVVSESAGIHDYALGVTNTPPTPPSITAPDIQSVDAPTAEEWSIAAGSDNSPTITVSNTVDSAPGPVYQIEFRIDGAGDWIVYGQFSVTSEKVELFGLEPETSYEIAVRATNAYNVLSDRTSLGSVTTGKAAATDVVPGSTLADTIAEATSDDLLTPSEKRDIVPGIAALLAERTSLVAQANAQTITVIPYTTAHNALNNYLATLTSPVAWDDLSGNTTVTGATLVSLWQALIEERDALRADLEADFQSEIEKAFNDNILTPVEKRDIIPAINALLNERAGLVNRATATGVSSTAYTTEHDDFTTYLATLTTPTAWDSLSGNTSVSSSVFLAHWQALIEARDDLNDALGDDYQAGITDAQAEAERATSDGTITPSEKRDLVPLLNALIAEEAGLVASASDAGVSSATYAAEVDDLQGYLATLTTPVAWNSLAGDTTVVASTLLGHIQALEEARDALRTAIRDADKVEIDTALSNASQALSDAAQGISDAAAAASAAAAADAAAAAAQGDADAAQADAQLYGLPPWNGYIGAVSDVTLTENQLGGSPNAGEIEVSAGTFDHPTSGRISVGNYTITTPFESGTTPPGGRFFVVFSTTLASSRFSNGSHAANRFFCAVYNDALDRWEARDNSNVVDVFTPLASDVLVARAVKRSTDSEISTLTSWLSKPIVNAGDIAGQLAASQIAALEAAKITGQLTDSQIADIAAAKLTGQITETQITDGAISTAKIAAGAVSANEIAAGSVVADKIATNAITAAKIQAGAVEASKIAAGSIDTDKLVAGAVTTAKLDALAVNADKIAANAITAAKIDADAVTADKIAAGAVTATKIDVTNLQAVSATMGALSVNDHLAVTAGGYLRAEGTDGVARLGELGNGNFGFQIYNSNTLSSPIFIDLDAGIFSLDGVIIDDGTVAGSAIVANSITADRLDVNNLNAVSASIGTAGLTVDGPLTVTGNGALRIDGNGSSLIRAGKVAGDFVFLVQDTSGTALIDIQLGDGAGGGTEKFEIDGATLKNSTINGDKIAANAVTIDSYDSTATETTLTANTWTAAETTTITTTGGNVKIDYSFALQFASDALSADTAQVRIKRGSTVIYGPVVVASLAIQVLSVFDESGQATLNTAEGLQAFTGLVTAFTRDATPGTGSVTYTLEVLISTPGGKISERNLMAVEFRDR